MPARWWASVSRRNPGSKIEIRLGDALETVRGPEREQPTGLFFYRQDAASIVDAVQQFEADYERFEPKACRANAERFSARRFAAEFEAYAEKCWNTFESKAPDERALANPGDSLVPDYPEYVPLRSGIPGVDDQGDPFIEHERFHASG